jgi:hypothetical protein
MNLIINGFHKKTLSSLVFEVLKHFKIECAHVIYDGWKFKTPSKVKVIFYNVKDLNEGNYKINWEKLTPLDENLMEEMNGCEVVVLKMMDRLPYDLSYDERKRLYLKHLRYWNDIFETSKIDIYISSNIPHEIYDYVIYCLCKQKKIPTIFFSQTNISDTVTIMENWESNATAIQDNYKELLKKYKRTKESEIILTGRFKRDFELGVDKAIPKRFEMLIKKPSHNVIDNLVSLLIRSKFDRLLFLIKRPHLLIRSINTYVGRIIFDRRMASFYNSNTIVPDLSKKYIYFPLHMQPEVSTSPMAGSFVNQSLIAQMIAYYLPKDIYIYVKENPYQTAVGRSMEFYKELLKISQVRLIPTSFDTYVLTNSSLAVATATGTAGLEALYRCKPVLMFGHNFYQYAKGIFQIKSNSDCQKAIKRILAGGFKLTIKDVKLFLKALEDTTVEGYIDPDYKIHTYITDSINNRNISQNLIKKIYNVCHL